MSAVIADVLVAVQALRAANLIWSAVRFRATLMEEKLEPEVFHLNPQKSNTPTYWNIMK